MIAKIDKLTLRYDKISVLEERLLEVEPNSALVINVRMSKLEILLDRLHAHSSAFTPLEAELGMLRTF